MHLAAKLRALSPLIAVVLATAFPAGASDYRTEYQFMGGTDGSAPDSNLIDIGGKLYGTTSHGGGPGMGTIFSFDPSTGVETTLYAFQGRSDGSSPGDLIDVQGKLYGVAAGGVVFSFDLSNNVITVIYYFQKLNERGGPTALLYSGGYLYGVTNGYRHGSIFSIDLTSGLENTLYTFSSPENGLEPNSLTDVDGVFYGTTTYGGSGTSCFLGCGTVFKFDPATGQESVVHSFEGSPDGSLPDTGNMIEVGGILYGTTTRGGNDKPEGAGTGYGTVFSIDPATGAETVLHAFKGKSDGEGPVGSLIAVGDLLYGATFRGGGVRHAVCDKIGCGTVFSLDLTTGSEQVDYAFSGKRSGFPYAGLTFANNTLFGTTVYGGNANCYQGCGTVFAIQP